LNNTNNEIFLPENFSKLSPAEQQAASIRDAMLKQNFVRFLSSGKGLAVLHAGVASFRDWPEYGNIIGARFENHPWNSGSTITLHIEDSSHSLCQVFPSSRFEVTDEIYQSVRVEDQTHPATQHLAERFQINDEIYQFKEFDRNKLRVLFSIDTSQIDLKNKSGIRRTDGDFALSWIKNYGKGRVFYSALGHQPDIYWNEILLRHFLAGIQFALGDLSASTKSIPAER
ncbi:MAG TPA: ThuA domain-containing protein, partial [Verrucomicrobiales bacterium]|nr:ThuA domain-containing protein [Verrucomicrobiales bacterium]